MVEIAINDKLVPWVKNGIKTCTTRSGKREYPLGQAYFVANESKEKISIEITKIEYIQFQDIDESLAQSENYQTANQLKESLLQYYPNLESSSIISVIHFKLK